MYLRIYLLLYADDTVLLAESATDLQLALYAMYDYCNLWDLNVNEDSFKVWYVANQRLEIHLIFIIMIKKLDIVDDFSYLGICFNYNANFSKAKRKLVEQARKAMFSVIQKSRKLNLYISIQLQLFDSMIAPILLYSCETWGFENVKIIDQFQLKYYKLILNLKSSTPSCMIYDELGVSLYHYK